MRRKVMGKIVGVWLGLELLVAWLFSHWFGVGSLLLSWLVAIFVGVYLLRGLGEQVRSLRQGAAGMALSGPLARVGAAMLFIIPGSLTDLLALLLLIPATQGRVARRWAASTHGWSKADSFGSGHGAGAQPGAGDIIEGEWVDETQQKPRIGPRQ